jgi:hypothetical protein
LYSIRHFAYISCSIENKLFSAIFR